MLKIGNRKLNAGSILFKIFIVGFLFLEVYPILWMLITSLKSSNEIAITHMYSLPKVLSFENYVVAWTRGKMGIFYKNSIISTFGSLIVMIIFALPVSFALTKMKWKLRESANALFSLGLLIPLQVVLIPLFIVFKNAGMINTLSSLTLSLAAFGMSLSIFLFTGYLKYIPDELIEAAVIDGCGIYSVFTKMIVPLLKNAIVTVMVTHFFSAWNDLVFSMTFISSTSKKTIQTGLLYFADEYGQMDWGPIFAAISMAIIPTILFYLILNKSVIKGLTAGAVKG